MTVPALEAAITSTRDVLAHTDRAQLGDPTPCAQWTVADLVNHIVGGQVFFRAGITGAPMGGEEQDFAAGDFLAAFDEASAATLAAFREDGAMDRVCNLPWGQMPGSAFAGLAATDTFTHGWDLAKATGQSTDLDPGLSATLLAAAQAMIQPAFRSEEGTVFGPERTVPDGASDADRLAAFLGRAV
jgi:uncharacterized protein (TIGR03086 family)